MGLNVGDLGLRGVNVYLSHSFWCRIEVHFGDLSVPFFQTLCSLLFGRTQKVRQNDFQKGLPRGPQESSRLDGSSMFTVAAGPKKGSNMGAKMERFGSQDRHYTPFCSPWSPKEAFKMRCRF